MLEDLTPETPLLPYGALVEDLGPDDLPVALAAAYERLTAAQAALGEQQARVMLAAAEVERGNLKLCPMNWHPSPAAAS